MFPHDDGASGEALDSDVVSGLDVEGVGDGCGDDGEPLAVLVSDASDMGVSVGYAERALHGGSVSPVGGCRKGANGVGC